MTDSPSSADPALSGCAVMEVRVGELRQLFNAMDPSPFRERDLDPGADEFIVSWSRHLARDARLALVVHLERPAGQADEEAQLADAIHQYYRQRGDSARQRLRELFGRGRVSLAIGLAFLGAAIGASELLAGWFGTAGAVELARQSLLIGGWVAMWRPLEIFLYDWWPIRAEARLFDRLAAMPVRLRHSARRGADAWRQDWPAVPAAARTAPGT